MNNMLSFDEVKEFLHIEQEELEKYLEEGKLHAYRIGGTYIRFRKEEIESLRYEIRPRKSFALPKRNVFSAVYDFWRFNNFYIISIAVAMAAIYWWLVTF